MLLVVLAVPNLFAGVWALLSPQGWYDNFPGYSPALISAYPPFNEHLIVDGGAGLVATGMAAFVAAIWPRREVVIAGMIVLLSAMVPHTLYHTFNPSDELATSENVVAAGSLGFSVAIAVYVLGRQFVGNQAADVVPATEGN